MPPVHQCNQGERISRIETTLELTNKAVMNEIKEIKTNMKEGFSSLAEKIDSLITHSEDTYAKKDELNMIGTRLSSIEKLSNSTKVLWIKNYGGWIATIITGLMGLAGIYFTKK